MTRDEKRTSIMSHVSDEMKGIVGKVLDALPASVWNGTPKNIGLWLSDDRQETEEEVLSEAELNAFHEYVLFGTSSPENGEWSGRGRNRRNIAGRVVKRRLTRPSEKKGDAKNDVP